MTQYIKKPIAIEAFKLTTRIEAPEWFTEAIVSGIAQPIENESYKIHGHDGNPNGGFAEIGDYIIKGIKGEIYVCKPDIFEASYDVMSRKPSHIRSEQIEHLKTQITYKFDKIGETGTLCSAYLGTFNIAREFSACVNPANYSQELGEKYAKEKLDKILDDKLWEFLGFALFKDLNEALFI